MNEEERRKFIARFDEIGNTPGIPRDIYEGAMRDLIRMDFDLSIALHALCTITYYAKTGSDVETLRQTAEHALALIRSY